jgi:hypothetical protein
MITIPASAATQKKPAATAPPANRSAPVISGPRRCDQLARLVARLRSVSELCMHAWCVDDVRWLRRPRAEMHKESNECKRFIRHIDLMFTNW